MYICENTETTVKIGPVTSKDGKAFNRKRLFQKEVFYALNSQSLGNFASTKDIPVDLDGYFNLALPAMTPGNLKIVVVLDGYPLQDFNITVLSRHAYSRMFSNEMQKVDAVNVPIENGHVVHDPNMIVGVDFAKCLNLDAEIAMPNTFLGGVGQVASPHVTDLSPVMNSMNDLASATGTRIDRLDTDLKACEEYLAKLDIMGENQRTTIHCMKELLAQIGQMEGAVKRLDTEVVLSEVAAVAELVANAIDAIAMTRITPETISQCVVEAAKGAATDKDVAQVAHALHALVEAVSGIKIPSVKEITGGGALDTQDGRVRIVTGKGHGEIELEDGLVHASDVVHKSGYSLGKDGLGSIKADIITCLKEEVVKLKPPAPVKITKQHHHH